MYVIGISSYYHDSSACLFENGKLVFACEEEKFTGIKHDSSFPNQTIKYIFEHYKLSKSDIECVCYYEDPKLRFNRTKSFFTSLINNIKVWYNLRKVSDKVYYTPHHISHMMYSYASSNFKESLVVSVDGVGETSTVSIGKGVDGELTQIKTVEYPHSLGLFYSAMTAFLGFKPNEGEYKVMGLASYGDPSVFREEVSELIKFENGEVICNMEYFSWDTSDISMFNHKLEEHLNIEPRYTKNAIEPFHKNLAASVQERYEEVLFDLLEFSKTLYNSDNLCLGGGCAYNGRANGKIVDRKMFKKLWVPPAPSDAGNAIGSCLYYLWKERGIKKRLHTNPFLGPHFSSKEIETALQKYKVLIHYNHTTRENVLRITANHIKNGSVIGWFQDRIEFGARALGNRSILADPTIPDMKDRINRVIKKREGFRPFAPMVAFENQHVYFKSNDYVPYMNQVVEVVEEYRDKLLAVTHVDNTARIQSVTPFNPIYSLIKKFEEVSGYPILLNTSFNVKDKTMVLTPEDAIITFLDTEMDVLVLGNYMVYKK